MHASYYCYSLTRSR